MSPADEDLERLLTQGCLSGATYDRIEASVMERVAPELRRQSTDQLPSSRPRRRLRRRWT
jgi:hypothetical protein